MCRFGYQEDELVVRDGTRRRTWDDEYVLKRQFSALIPAFDPRPGRTNVAQTQDFEIPAPGAPESTTSEATEGRIQPDLQLFFKGPGLPGVRTFLHLNICLVTKCCSVLTVKIFSSVIV